MLIALMCLGVRVRVWGWVGGGVGYVAMGGEGVEGVGINVFCGGYELNVNKHHLLSYNGNFITNTFSVLTK